MKKLLLSAVLTLISAIGFTQTEQVQATGPCLSGDCQNGYGYYYNETTQIVYVGWFKDGLYDGPGYSQNPDGSYVFSDFTKGKADGYSVYEFGQGKGSGMFVMGVKQGDHFLERKSATMARMLVSYKDDVITAEKLQEITTLTEIGECMSGDCMNGFGIKRQANDKVLIGVFKAGALVYGEDLNPFTQVSSFKEYVTGSTFEYRYYNKDGIEIAGDYKDDKRNGRTIMLKLSEGVVQGAITEEGNVVKRF
jgi:hypothetical protein